MSTIFIQNITIKTKLTQHLNGMDQIVIIKRLWTKLKYGVKDKDQICSLPQLLIKLCITLEIAT